MNYIKTACVIWAMIPIVSITEKEICIVFHTEGGIFFLKYAKTINKSKIIHTIFPLMDAEVFSAKKAMYQRKNKKQPSIY